MTYRKQLKARLAKTLAELKISKPKELTKEEDRALLLVNGNVMRAFKRALRYYAAGKIDKADEIICDIPHYMAGMAATESRYSGTTASYTRFDGIRHLIRMASIEEENKPIGESKIWNSTSLLA